MFNPNDIGQPNGTYFALPYNFDECEIALISVPWDVTTSYKPGTANGPEAIINASVQVDLFDFDVKDAWKIKIGTTELDFGLENDKYRKLAEQVIAYLEDGGSQNDEEIQLLLQQVNTASEQLNDLVYTRAKALLGEGKIAAVVGGEHSVPFGLIKAVAEKYHGVGVLHIDAHADLRETYEGFEYSHASIMYNVIHKIEGVSKLVQVGIRDLCQEEADLVAKKDNIVMFNDYDLNEAAFAGTTWAAQCTEIIKQLPQNVHISFDIDGLLPEYCPSTGTPVPGGLTFNQAIYLLKQVVESGRTIVGFDLCEVAPGEDNDWDANVGARILYKLCCYTHAANSKTVSS